jgi:hypothetical protein
VDIRSLGAALPVRMGKSGSPSTSRGTSDCGLRSKLSDCLRYESSIINN